MICKNQRHKDLESSFLYFFFTRSTEKFCFNLNRPFKYLLKIATKFNFFSQEISLSTDQKPAVNEIYQHMIL